MEMNTSEKFNRFKEKYYWEIGNDYEGNRPLCADEFDDIIDNVYRLREKLGWWEGKWDYDMFAEISRKREEICSLNEMKEYYKIIPEDIVDCLSGFMSSCDMPLSALAECEYTGEIDDIVLWYAVNKMEELEKNPDHDMEEEYEEDFKEFKEKADFDALCLVSGYKAAIKARKKRFMDRVICPSTGVVIEDAYNVYEKIAEYEGTEEERFEKALSIARNLIYREPVMYRNRTGMFIDYMEWAYEGMDEFSETISVMVNGMETVIHVKNRKDGDINIPYAYIDEDRKHFVEAECLEDEDLRWERYKEIYKELIEEAKNR